MARFYTNTILMPADVEHKKEDFECLMQARAAFDALSSFRRYRERCKKFMYGDQWSDLVEYNGKMIREDEYLRLQGSVPLKNNVIRKHIKTAIGNYIGQSKEPICKAYDRDEQRLGEVMTTALQANNRKNKFSELCTRWCEEYMMSGAVFAKETHGYLGRDRDCWTDMVSPSEMFFDGPMRDIRHNDINLIGQIHDLSLGQMLSYFAKSPEDHRKLCHIYSQARDSVMLTKVLKDMQGRHINNIDFFVPYDTSLCRVIEVWRKEQKPRYRCHDTLTGKLYKVELEDVEAVEEKNRQRIEQGRRGGLSDEQMKLIDIEFFYDDYWYYRFFTPFGDVLDDGETPYEHGEHPYVMKLYPFIDGEVHSLVADIIDQQKYINRLVTLNDFVIRAGSKGALMMPEDGISDKMNLREVATEWVKPNGLVLYKPSKSGERPHQATQAGYNVGINEMLSLQLKLIEDISGISGALQGKAGFAGMSADLYRQQQQNSSTTLLDILESFSSFVVDIAQKKVDNMLQFYDEERWIDVVGNTARVLYDPKVMGSVSRYDVSIIESSATPVARDAANAILLEMFKMGAINIRQLLEVGSFPFADELIESLNNQEAALANGDAKRAGLSPELMQQVHNNANEDVVSTLIRNATGGSDAGMQ